MTYFDLETGTIENEHLIVEYLRDSSLRLIRLIHKPTGINLFAETPDFNFDTARGKYYLRGGHRLWVSPESWDITYALEHQDIQCDRLENGIVLKQNGTSACNLSKEIRVEMDVHESRIRLTESIRNDTSMLLTCSPWGLSMMAPGGTAIAPLRTASEQPGGLLPDRNLVLWPYTHLTDPRLDLRDSVVMIHSNDRREALKIGIRSPQGWLAYLYHGLAFVIHSVYQDAVTYPDYGCNMEVYTNGVFVELEILAGLSDLAPGHQVTLKEEWEVFPFSGTPEALFDQLNRSFPQ